jgi:bifunctional non-homologous end joining protein LigD
MPKKLNAPASKKAVEAQLARYRAMRDFHQTSEPEGDAKGKRSRSGLPNSALPFVIQKHAATRLHYDFRLGWNGVLKSWAVAKGPSYFPGDKRLAVQVEDHPIEYGGFEGTIPKGQYGGGTVMVWDEGTWDPLGDVDKGLKDGNLKFALHGKKMHGKWALIRMGGRMANEAKPNWLLIKEHDEYEQGADGTPVTDKSKLSVVTGRDLDAIARDADHIWNSNRPEDKKTVASPRNSDNVVKRDYLNGLSGTKKEALPEFILPQLAMQASSPPHGSGWLHELKMDGYRVQARIHNGNRRSVRLLTRKGLNWTERMKSIAAAVEALPIESAIVDGEVVVLSEDGTTNFGDLQAAFQEGTAKQLTYFMFDLLYLNGQNLRSLPLEKRKQILADLLAATEPNDTLRFSEHLGADAEEIFSKACELGAEGIVSKRASSRYTSGRSDSWLKLKCHREQEMVIGG